MAELIGDGFVGGPFPEDTVQESTSSADNYMQWDASAQDLILAGAASFQTSQTGSGYSFNLISVTADGASNNTRGWRVNCTTTASQTQGDLQCIHGYLTTGASVTLAANAAVYPLSAWLDLPADVTTGTGNVVTGLRVIVDVNGTDRTTMAGGGESALGYFQQWASAGAIDHGIRVVNGAGATIGDAFGVGGSGTFSRLFDFTEVGDTETEIVVFGNQDAQTRKVRMFIGDLATRAAIRAQVGDLVGMGSLYFSTAGEAYIKVAGATADTDWEVLDHTASDTG
ncbi:MAG: hypothetical protein ACYTBZ_27780 [Planctomycetota bacterium]|jgi:hypothetical protein